MEFCSSRTLFILLLSTKAHHKWAHCQTPFFWQVWSVLLGFWDLQGLVLALGHSSKKDDSDSLVMTWLQKHQKGEKYWLNVQEGIRPRRATKAEAQKLPRCRRLSVTLMPLRHQAVALMEALLVIFLRLFSLPPLNPLRHLFSQRRLSELGNPTLHWPQPETPAVWWGGTCPLSTPHGRHFNQPSEEKHSKPTFPPKAFSCTK